MINMGLRNRVRHKKTKSAGPWTMVLSAMVVILLVFLVSMVLLVYRMSLMTTTSTSMGRKDASGGALMGPNVLKNSNNNNNNDKKNKVERKTTNLLRAGSSHTWISPESQPFVSFSVRLLEPISRRRFYRTCFFCVFGSCSLWSRPPPFFSIIRWYIFLVVDRIKVIPRVRHII
jgi:hypothetical protein